VQPTRLHCVDLVAAPGARAVGSGDVLADAQAPHALEMMPVGAGDLDRVG
jgi:hypothetical protein